MFLFKLDAINSTNSYLKELSKGIDVKNWTVVLTEFQTEGRGEMGTKWESNKDKNLLCSVLIKFNNLYVHDQFYLNCAISLGIYNALQKYDLPQLKLKWPNDIMAVNKKLGGVLIENSLVNNKIYQSVVGIGLNVNQEVFSDQLPLAVSIKNILEKNADRNKLLDELINSIKEQINFLENKKFERLLKNYEKVLFKKDVPYIFEDKNKKRFLGKILGVTTDGNLIVESRNQKTREFAFKEIRFI